MTVIPQEPSDDPLERLEHRVDEIPAAKLRRELGEALQSAVRGVQEAEESISRLEQLAGFTALIRGSFDSEDHRQFVSVLQEIRKIGQAVATATGQDDLIQAKSMLLLAFRKDVQGLEMLVQRAWKALIDRDFSSIGRLGKVLEQISETHALGHDMTSVRAQAENLASKLLSVEEHQASLGRLTSARDKLIDSLIDLGTGDAVIKFLLAVAGESATLTNVTEEVSVWLKQHQALDRFKVGL